VKFFAVLIFAYKMSAVYTITFSESVENHKGMEILGSKAAKGFDIEDLEKLCENFNGEEIVLNYLDEHDPATVVIFRDGLKRIFGIDEAALYREQAVLQKDTKCLMYGRVVNKKARHNLCFDDFSQAPDYEFGKGTVVNFESQPLLSELRKNLGEKFGADFQNLKAEGNYYYDPKKCYIGFHGDTERSKVVGVRLGCSFPLHYQWYVDGEAQGEIMSLDLNGGDIYIMSEKAVGSDWKKKKIYTLRHAAGDLKNCGK